MPPASPSDSPWAGWRWFRAAWRTMPELQDRDLETARRVFNQAEFRATSDGLMLAIGFTGVVLQLLLALLCLSVTHGEASLFWLIIIPGVLAIAVLHHWLAYPVLRRRVRHELRTHCPRCDYDLRQTPTRCPECGQNPATPTRAQT